MPTKRQSSKSTKPAASTDPPGAFTLFKPSWEGLRLNLWPFAFGAIFPFIFLAVPLLIVLSHLYATPGKPDAYSMTSVSSSYSAMIVAAGIVGAIALVFFYVPYLYILKFRSAKGVKMTVGKTFKQCLPFAWRLVGLYLLRGLIILAGTILVVVPGFFMWRRYMLAPFYLIDKNTGIWDAMKECAEDSRPFGPAIWGLIGIYALLSLVGIIPLIGWAIGTVLSIVYCCAQALRYLQIKKAKA